VRLRFHLTALSEDDTIAYIRHRLRIAGAVDRELFASDTFPIIYRYAGGIPRLVNTLCDTALIAAFAQDRTSVSAADVMSAIGELQWVEYASRTASHQQVQIETTASHEQPPVGRLVLKLKGVQVGELNLLPGRRFIGRTSDNDLQIDSRYVSRHHAQVVTTTDGSWIEDLNSTNGIFVRGHRVRRHRLQEGDAVDIGVHQLCYERVQPLVTATTVLPADALDDEDDEDDEANGGPEAEVEVEARADVDEDEDR
jgi:hypothetical protein